MKSGRLTCNPDTISRIPDPGRLVGTYFRGRRFTGGIRLLDGRAVLGSNLGIARLDDGEEKANIIRYRREAVSSSFQGFRWN